MTGRFGWTAVVAVEAMVVVILLPLGLVYIGVSQIHQMQLLILGSVGAAGWIAVAWRPTALTWPVLVAPLPLLAAMALSSLAGAYPTLTWSATWMTAAYGGIFWLLALQASHIDGRRNLIAVIGIVVILALVTFLVAVLLEWRDWLDLGFPVTSLPLRPRSVGGLAQIPTWLADVLAIGSPLVVANLWSRGARIAATILGLVVLAAIVLTGTRSVLLIVAIAATVSIVLVLISAGRRAPRRVVAVVVGVAIALGIAMSLVAFGSSRSFDEGRSSAYASAVTQIAESPVLGTGPATYAVERMRDSVEVLGHLTFPDAHNIVFTTVAETGIVGLAGLLATIAFVGLAIRRSWRASQDDRPIIVGALFGVAILAGHGMVDVIFALSGIVLVAIGVVSLAATNTTARAPTRGPAVTYPRAGISVSLLVFVVLTGAVLRTEATYGSVADADDSVASDPAAALAMARMATAAAPDLVPGWWVQMVAADAAGESATAIAAARKMVELEGFGQQWMSLAILASRMGDRATELDAIAHATAGPPVDPLVEVNVIPLFNAAGDQAAAEAAARRLLTAQPDIEPILGSGPPAVAAAAAAVRADLAMDLLAGGEPSSAFLVALSGEDRTLADRLLASLAMTDPAGAADWRTVVEAWFGDATARVAHDRSARADLTLEQTLWAWRLAGRACDDAASTFWERVAAIAFSVEPSTPNRLLLAPTSQANQLPSRYPSYVWKLGNPQRPYVGGTWTYASGRPICAASSSS